jgi:hypothetical protein
MRRTDTNQIIEVRVERLDGAPVGERRRWSDDFKDGVVAASLEPETNISALPRSLSADSDERAPLYRYDPARAPCSLTDEIGTVKLTRFHAAFSNGGVGSNIQAK